ncbi:uncharacterized protein DUF4386 [Cohnella sp. SGD-V74]|uniref:DUF4386 domain-containing protein n=1 Tax=unclassified Cohnella TaxID=2636738 RepID=UPI000D4106FF|nr:MULTISPECIES: DUF4386 domain-containing protein [unclassified Cohnella]PRX58518.1 uncharacterized protein DUF4386 [Cohnella sp. SGD-V74]
MKTYRKSAAVAGALFLAATAAYMPGNALTESAAGTSDYLAHAADNRDRVILGVLLELLNSAAVVGIAIALFPILKLCNEKIALGYVAFRAFGPLSFVRDAMTYSNPKTKHCKRNKYYATIASIRGTEGCPAMGVINFVRLRFVALCH